MPAIFLPERVWVEHRHGAYWVSLKAERTWPEEAVQAGAVKASLLTSKEMIFLKQESSMESIGEKSEKGRPFLGIKERLGGPLAWHSSIAFSSPKTSART